MDRNGENGEIMNSFKEKTSLNDCPYDCIGIIVSFLHKYNDLINLMLTSKDFYWFFESKACENIIFMIDIDMIRDYYRKLKKLLQKPIKFVKKLYIDEVSMNKNDVICVLSFPKIAKNKNIFIKTMRKNININKRKKEIMNSSNEIFSFFPNLKEFACGKRFQWNLGKGKGKGKGNKNKCKPFGNLNSELIEKLYLTTNKNIFVNGLAKGIYKMVNMVELKLINFQISLEFITQLGEKCYNLKKLTVINCFVTLKTNEKKKNDTYRPSEYFYKDKKVEEYFYSIAKNCIIIPIPKKLEYLKFNQFGIGVFEISFNWYNFFDICKVFNIKWKFSEIPSTLKYLNLSNNKYNMFTDWEISDINYSVTYLDLSATELKNEDLKKISEKFHNLRMFEMRCIWKIINDEGIKHILGMLNLETLKITFYRISSITSNSNLLKKRMGKQEINGKTVMVM